MITAGQVFGATLGFVLPLETDPQLGYISPTTRSLAVNGDGVVVVGSSRYEDARYDGPVERAVRWVDRTPALLGIASEVLPLAPRDEGLGLTGFDLFTWSSATAVNSEGTFVVGAHGLPRDLNKTHGPSFTWTSDTGTRLIPVGFSSAERTVVPENPTDMTANGELVVGGNPLGFGEPWVWIAKSNTTVSAEDYLEDNGVDPVLLREWTFTNLPGISPDGSAMIFNGTRSGSPDVRALLVTGLPRVPDCADLTGDTDGDADVDLDDLLNVVINFGLGVPPFTSGDNNGDGEVDLDDLLNVVINFGVTCAH